MISFSLRSADFDTSPVAGAGENVSLERIGHYDSPAAAAAKAREKERAADADTLAETASLVPILWLEVKEGANARKESD